MNIDKAIGHMAYLAALNEERHPVINESLPQIVTSLDMVKDILISFRDKL